MATRVNTYDITLVHDTTITIATVANAQILGFRAIHELVPQKGRPQLFILEDDTQVAADMDFVVVQAGTDVATSVGSFVGVLDHITGCFLLFHAV